MWKMPPKYKPPKDIKTLGNPWKTPGKCDLTTKCNILQMQYGEHDRHHASGVRWGKPLKCIILRQFW